eukprot:859858-Prorocentrum_minimum.AAC.2
MGGGRDTDCKYRTTKSRLTTTKTPAYHLLKPTGQEMANVTASHALALLEEATLVCHANHVPTVGVAVACERFPAQPTP